MSARFGIFLYFFAFLRRLFGQLWTALLALLGFCHWHNLGHTRKSTTEHGLVLGAGAVSLGKECHRLCYRLCYRLSQWHRIQLAHISSTLWRDSQLQFHSMLEVKISHLRMGSCLQCPRFGIIRISRAKQKRSKNYGNYGLWTFITWNEDEWRR